MSRIDEIRENLKLMTPSTHDMVWALQEIERLRRELDAAKAENERLQDVIKSIEYKMPGDSDNPDLAGWLDTVWEVLDKEAGRDVDGMDVLQ